MRPNYSSTHAPCAVDAQANAERRLAIAARLAGVARQIAHSPDYAAALRQAPSLLVPAIADACALFVARPPGELALLALHEPLHEGCLSSAGLLDLVRQSYERAEPMLLPRLTPEARHRQTADPGEAPLLTGADATMIMPLVSCGRATGVLVLAQRESGRVWGQDDPELFQGLALGLAAAIDNAGPRVSAEPEAAARAQTAESHREGEAIFKAIFSSSDIGIVLLKVTDQQIYRNEAFVRLVGYSADELRERTVASISHPDDLAQEQRLIAEMEAGARSHYRIEKRYIHKDGRIVPTELAVSGLRDEAGILRWVIAIIEDISTRKAAEEALRASEARYRSLIEHQQDLVVRMLPDGTRTFVNDAYCRHLGLSREELLGTNLYDNIHPDDHAQTRARAEAYKRGEELPTGLSRVVRGDGSVSWYEWTGRGILDSTGRLIEVQAVGRDVTERQRAQAERIALERKLLEAQKVESLGVLAGGIAHDFNNILTAILGHAELALLDLPPDGRLYSDIAMIIERAQRAAELTRQILAYSGQGRAMVRRVSWNQVVASMSGLIHAAVSPHCRISVTLSALLPMVEADQEQLRQVLLNLLVNASEAIGEVDGDVIVSTGVAALSRPELAALALGENLAAGHYVYLKVSDNGCGMAESMLPRIFDPFFSTKFTGRGLGLAAVQGIVRGHRGALSVSSRPGEGTVFTIWLPAVAG